MSDDMYFEPPTRMQLVDKLAHLLRFSYAFTVLSGPRGSGLTTVMNQVTSELAEGDAMVLAPALQDQTNLTSLLSLLNSTIDNIDNDDASDPLAEFHWKVEYLIHSGKKIFLCLDNADYLHEEALQCLINLHIANSENIGIILAGSQKFSTELESVAANIGAIKNLQIQKLLPFNQLETQEFIGQYFVRGSDFSKKQIVEIFNKSQGYPGRIVAITTEMIKVGKIGLNEKNGLLPMPHKISIGVLLVAIVGALSWQIVNEGSTEDLASDKQAAIKTTGLALDFSEESTTRTEELSLEEQIAALTQQIDGHKKDIQGLELEETQLLVDQTITVNNNGLTTEQNLVDSDKDIATDELGSADDVTDIVLYEDINNELLNTDIVEQQVSKVGDVTQQLNDFSASIKSDVELALSEETLAPQLASETATTTNENAAPAIVKTETSKVAKVIEQPVVANNNWSGTDSIKQWPNKGYTLQLLAASNNNSAVKFLNSAPQAQRMFLYQTQIKGKLWSVVVYGQYSTRANATAAIAKLPSELQQLKPWIKSINSVKKAIE